MNLTTYSSLVQTWYQWGHFVALAVALAATFWIFYGAARRGVGATIWKVLGVISVVLVLPSTVFWGFPTLFIGRLAAAVEPLAYVGLGAAALALLSLFLYLLGVGVGPEVTHCPVCGQPQHPSWDYCPYCAQQQAQQTGAATAVAAPLPPPPSPPLTPTTPVAPQPVEAPPLRVEKTEVLQPARPEQLAWLVLTSGTHAGKEFRLGETTTIGRDPARNDVVVDDSAVSRQHAKVKLEEGRFVLYDLASAGGTMVRSQEAEEWVDVQKHVLMNGDQIKMGRETFTFMQVTGEQGEHG